MCGFVGGVFRRPVGQTETAQMRAAVRVLAHRGPDAEQISVMPEARAILAFRRLSIIDLATGDQPMALPSGRQIVFNGEIYNYREIRDELRRSGVRFKTTSDTEVLLHCIEREGIAGLAPLRGMFGFASIDPSAKQLLLARDRLGVKQLYYIHCHVGFFFASEPKALLALPWVKAELAQEQLPAYFMFRSVPAPATLFRGISKLGPGVALTLDFRTWRTTTTRYWTFPQPAGPEGGVSIGGGIDRLEAVLMDAVRRRLVSDVPVGAFLSGGLDSSLIVAGIRRVGHPGLKTFTAGFPGSRDDESRFAQRVSQRFGAENYQYPLQHADFLNAIPRWVDLNDDLVADASSLPLLCVSDLARRHGCIVMLSGEGADELFGGYGSYHKFKALSWFASLVPGQRIRRSALDAAHQWGIVGGNDLPRIREYFVLRRGYMGTAALLGGDELRELLDGDLASTPLPRAEGRSFAQMGAFDFARRIPDDLLVRTDRATMGASVEARVPFLDHDLVELAVRLPSALRSLPGISKVALRAIALRWGVPRQTVLHRKIGFQIPIGDWFRGSLAPVWRQVLKRRAVPGLRYDAVQSLVDRHLTGRANLGDILWRVLALEMWYARWVTGSALELGGPETEPDALIPARGAA